MRFLSLQTASVASVPDKRWKFRSGLQLIRGPNEAGKTSMRRAILLALFCDAGSRRADVRALRRWDAESDMSIELEFEHDGRRYRLVRDFAQKHNQLEESGGASWRNKEQIANHIAEMLGLPDEHALLATACMSQDELPISDPGRIYHLIEKNVVCGTGVDVDQLVGKLERGIRARSKGLERAVAAPGIVRQLQDRLDELNQEWARVKHELEDCENASSELVACQKELEEAENRKNILQERLARHTAYRDSREQHDRASQAFLQVEQQQKRAAGLDLQVAQLHEEIAQNSAPVQELRSNVRNWAERERLAKELQNARATLENRSQQWTGISEVRSRIDALRSELEAQPIRPDEARNAYLALPTEIARDREAVEAERAAQNERQQEVTASEQQLVSVHAELEGLREQRAVLDADRQQAMTCEALEAELATAGRQLSEIKSTLSRLDALESEIACQRSVVRPLPADLPQVHAAVTELSAALSKESIHLRFEPEHVIEAHLALDGGAAEPVTGPSDSDFRRGAELTLSGVAIIRIENRGTLAAELAEREAAFRRLLASCGFTGWEEFQQAQQRNAEASRDITEKEAEKRALLRNRSRAELTASSTEVNAKVQDIGARLSVAGASAAGTSAEIGRELVGLERKLAEKAQQEAGLHSRLGALRQMLTGSATLKQLEQDIGVRMAKLATILKRAVVRQPEDLKPLVETFERIELERQQAEMHLAELLAGARPQDVHSRLQEDLARVDKRAVALDAIPDPRWTADEAAAGKEELARAEQQLHGLEEQLRLASAARQVIDTAALQNHHDELSVELAALNSSLKKLKEFELSPNDLLKLENDLNVLDGLIRRQVEEIGKWRDRAGREEGLRERLLTIEEQIEFDGARLTDARVRLDVDKDVLELIQRAREEAAAGIRKQLPTYAGRYLQIATAGRYKTVRGEGLEAAVYSPAKKDVLAEVELSSGTADQLYLARRLAALKALFGKQLPPLLLDDILVHCDSERRRCLLKLLRDFAEDTQVLLFTCHDYREYAGIPSLNLVQSTPAS